MAAPKRRNLAAYLRQHPECEVFEAQNSAVATYDGGDWRAEEEAAAAAARAAAAKAAAAKAAADAAAAAESIPEDVPALLRLCQLPASYAEQFEEDGYDNVAWMLELSDDNMRQMARDVGMTKKGHVMRLVTVTSALRAEQQRRKAAAA